MIYVLHSKPPLIQNTKNVILNEDINLFFKSRLYFVFLPCEMHYEYMLKQKQKIYINALFTKIPEIKIFIFPKRTTLLI